MRADQWLLEHGRAASRSQAQRLIAGGARWRAHSGEAWRVLSKSDTLPPSAQVELSDASEAKYVSRGGLKLEGALRRVGIDVTGLDCLDVGQSTGGFTDCLLQHGARRVVGVDVGHAQLHERLRHDPRVHCLEGINARSDLMNAIINIASNQAQMPAIRQFDVKNGGHSNWTPLFTCMDVSFISQTLIVPQLAAVLPTGAALLALVKPQFELQANDLGKGGIVRDEALYAQVETKIRSAYQDHGFHVHQWLDSPIEGGDGNREFFIHAQRG